VPAKADIYVPSDTTGSMTSIIGAVQAGIGAVVIDAAFGGFDAAWGAGTPEMAAQIGSWWSISQPPCWVR
jgi:hypothetical protein